MLNRKTELPDDLEVLASCIVDCIFHVHKNLGPGYPERIYESALIYEIIQKKINFEQQKIIKVIYPPDVILDPEYRLDIVVENRIILELKCVEHILPVHQAQLYSYMRMSGIHLGFLINFNVPLIKDGIRRQVL